MEAVTAQAKPFTPFQIEMLELASRVSSETEMQDIRRLLVQVNPSALEVLVYKGKKAIGVTRRAYNNRWSASTMNSHHD